MNNIEILRKIINYDCEREKIIEMIILQHVNNTKDYNLLNILNKNTELINFASRNGHFEIIKWLRENGAPWNETAINNASQNGHFEIVKWLRENGVPWGGLAIAYTSESGHLELVEWLRENKRQNNFLIIKIE